jgi:hypothetical protein
MNSVKFSKWLEASAEFVNLSKFAGLATEPLKKDYAIRHVLIPDPVKTPDKHMSEASLLRPDLRIVEFDYRAAEFEDLCNWCNSSEAFGWRLVHGDSGRGKSRLMVELCAHLNGHATGNDWIAGFVNVERFRGDPEAFDLLFDTPKPLLIVLDYAERQSEIVTQLLKRSYQAAVKFPERTNRIALVARRSTDVWDQIFRQDCDLHLLGRRTLADIRLSPVTETAAIEAVFASAFKAFSTHLGKSHSAPQFNFSMLAPKGGHPDIGLVHMLALLAAIAPGELSWQVNDRPTQDELLDHVLGRERRVWQKTAEGKGLPTELRTEPVLLEAAALLTIASQQGAIGNAHEARNVLRKGTLLAGQSEAQLDQLVSVFRETYPGIGYVNGVVPDLLGDYLFTQQMSGS